MTIIKINMTKLWSFTSCLNIFCPKILLLKFNKVHNFILIIVPESYLGRSFTQKIFKINEKAGPKIATEIPIKMQYSYSWFEIVIVYHKNDSA